MKGILMVTDAELNKFMDVNFSGRKNVNLELVRDILTLSKLYDRNFERIREANKVYDLGRARHFLNIEKKMDDASNLMRDAAGIRARITRTNVESMKDLHKNPLKKRGRPRSKC